MVCIQLCTIFDGGLKLKNDVIYEAIIEKGYCLLSFFFYEEGPAYKSAVPHGMHSSYLHQSFMLDGNSPKILGNLGRGGAKSM